MAAIHPLPAFLSSANAHVLSIRNLASSNPIAELGDVLNDQIDKLAHEMPTCPHIEDQDDLPSECDTFSNMLNEGFTPASCNTNIGDTLAGQVQHLICGCKAWDPKKFENAAKPCLAKVCKENEVKAVKFVTDYAETFKKQCDIYVPKIEVFTRSHTELFVATKTAPSKSHSTSGYWDATTTHHGNAPTTTGSGNIHHGGLGNAPIGDDKLSPTSHHGGKHSAGSKSGVSLMGTMSALLVVGALLSAL